MSESELWFIIDQMLMPWSLKSWWSEKGQAEHHVWVVLEHSQRPEIHPAKRLDTEVPDGRRRNLTVPPDTQLGDPRIHQSYGLNSKGHKKQGSKEKRP